MSLVTKYSESPVRLMENQKLVEIQFPNTATEIIGLNTDNLTKIDVSKCSKDFVNTVKSSYQDKSNNSGGSIEVVEPQPNNEIWYTASEKLTETTSQYSNGLYTNTFDVTLTSHTFEGGKGVVTFDGDVISIGEYAFYGCKGLTSVTIPDGVTSIGQSAFQDCPGLTSVNIGDNIATIGNGVFVYCSGLKSVTIPDNVTSIGREAFWNCSGLTSVIYKGRTYTSKSSIESELSANGVTVGTNVFKNTKLS